jgi:hypothetical protein
VLTTVVAPGAPSAPSSPAAGNVALTLPAVSSVGSALQPVVQTATAVTQPLLSTVSGVTQPLVQTVEAVTQPVLQTVAAVAQPVVNTVEAVTQPLAQTVAAVTEPVLQTVGAVTQPLVTTVASVAPPVGEVVQALTQPILGPAAVAAPAPSSGQTGPVLTPLVEGTTQNFILPTSGTTGATGRPGVESSGPAGVPALLPANTAPVVADGTALAGRAGTTVPAVPVTAAAPRLSRDLFLLPQATAGSTVASEPASTPADQQPHAVQQTGDSFDSLTLDLALWGAANEDQMPDSVAVELPGAPVTPGWVVSADVLGEALLPDGGTDAAAAPQADLLAGCVPFDPRTLDLALQRLLDQLHGLAWDFSSVLSHLRGTPWFLALAVGAVACEMARRRLQERVAGKAALAGGGGTLTWFPSLTAPGDRDGA